MVIFSNYVWIAMDFPERLSKLRKERKLTQRELAERVDVHIMQIQRYDNGSTQPKLDITRKLATTLAVSADELIFGEGERDPIDELKRQLEALSQFDEEDRNVAKAVFESLILKHNAKRAFADQIQGANK